MTTETERQLPQMWLVTVLEQLLTLLTRLLMWIMMSGSALSMLRLNLGSFE